MHPRHSLGLSALFLLLVTELQVQSAPTEPASVYNKLHELTTSNKCTYLQQTTLLERREHWSLQDCGSYDEVIKADFSNSYNQEKLHCLLYYDTFKELCNSGNGDLARKLLSEASIKNALTKPVENVCGSIHSFYKSYNSSKVASVMEQDKLCERVCENMKGNQAMEACSLAALMIFVQNQMKMQPVPQSAQTDEFAEKKLAVMAVAAQSSSQVSKPDPEEDKSVVIQNAPKPNAPVAIDASGQLQVQQNKFPDPGPVPGEVQTAPGGTDDGTKTQSKGPNQDESAPAPAPAADDKESAPEAKADVSIEKPSPKSADIATADKKPNQSTPGKIAKVTASGAVAKPASAPEAEVKNKPANAEDEQAAKKQSSSSPRTIATAEESDIGLDELEQPEPEEDDPVAETGPAVLTTKPPKEKPKSTNPNGEGAENINHDMTTSELSNDSYFFSYFMLFCILFVMGYVGYHNKQKLLALFLEGRRGRRQPRRRPNSANYHKLDSNLEEAVTSSCDKTTSNVIY